MEIIVSDFGGTAREITLVGRLDIAGAEQIGLPLAAAAGARGNVVIDMIGVDFISSIGVRHLVMAARTVGRGAGKLVLLNPTLTVTEVLTVAGVDALLPVVRSEAEARAAFLGTAGT